MLSYTQRIKKTVASLPEYGLDALLIEDPTNIGYLTGLDISLGQLLISAKKAIIFLDGRYYASAKKKSPVEVRLASDEALFELLSKSKGLGFDEENTSFARYEMLKKIKTLKPVANIVKNKVRIIKSASEIALMKKSAELAAKGYTHAVKALKTGITEEEVAGILKIFWLEKGAEGFSFEPIIAFGAHSANPHHRPTGKKLKSGDIVLFDLGVTLHKYASDMTRVLFFGKPKPQLVAIYEIVHEAHERALKKCRSGAKIAGLDTASRGFITKSGYGDKYPHALGHGIGLEVHEAPFMKNNKLPLESGMVITIEPGIYLPGLGGVRLEDTLVITQNGYESLTLLSKDIIILS